MQALKSHHTGYKNLIPVLKLEFFLNQAEWMLFFFLLDELSNTNPEVLSSTFEQEIHNKKNNKPVSFKTCKD